MGAAHRLQGDSVDELLAAKARAEAKGLDVLGPTDHGIFKSIYFFDPNGHRVELAADTGTAEELAELKRVAPAMLEEWSRTKKAPQHAAWLHEKARARTRRSRGSGRSADSGRVDCFATWRTERWRVTIARAGRDAVGRRQRADTMRAKPATRRSEGCVCLSATARVDRVKRWP